MEKEIIENLELDEIDIEYDKVYKKKKRRVIKRGVLLFISFVLIVSIGCFAMFSETFKLTDVNITGNVYLRDSDVIEYANVRVDSSIIVAYLTEIEQNIEKHEIVKNARVSYDDLNTISIVIEEEEVLFVTEGGVYLSSEAFVKTDVFSSAVDFENFNEVEKKDEVLNELVLLLEKAPEVYEFVSQISYVPDTVTNDRIMFVMRDTNIVYLSTDQISDKMSKYFDVVDSIYSELGVTHGELSFDKGGEFKPY